MILEIKIPSPGESVTEVAIGSWLVEDGDIVEKDQDVAEIESDKATLPLIAPASGKIKLMFKPGENIRVGDVACTIDTDFAKVNRENINKKSIDIQTSQKADDPSSLKQGNRISLPFDSNKKMNEPQEDIQSHIKITPLARRKMTENNLNVDDIIKGLRRITTNEIDRVIKSNHNLKSEGGQTGYGKRNVNRQPMSPLRRKLSKRLVAVKNETAMLTTFNEVDMSAMLEIRRRYQQSFQERHGIKLGLMSFFARASAQALLQFPLINSALEEDEIITPSFVDLGIAVQTEKGLMVPVIRNAESMSIPELEKHIAELARKARSKQITIEEMTGGTFTITNGGVFGSMLSTPILNPPQSAILGMHNIVERPVAIRGQVEIRPVMYVALSYDHRIIDGSSSVQFLVRIKELIETPLKMLSLNDPEKDLLQL